MVGTEMNPVQIHEAKIAGSAKYRKGRQLSGDVGEDENDIDEDE